MTQVVSIHKQASDRAGFRSKSLHSRYEDFKATCAKYGRMDLWHRLDATAKGKHVSGRVLVVLCKLLQQNRPIQCERYLAKIETGATDIDVVARIYGIRARNPNKTVKCKAKDKPALRLTDPCAGIGDDYGEEAQAPQTLEEEVKF